MSTDPSPPTHPAGAVGGARGPAALSCQCGKVRGELVDASPGNVNRIICYCDDCQAFARYLGRPDLLDARGGSDIVQVAPARLAFVEGQENIRGVRLSPKGLYRWHSACCNTPLGNTASPAIPFVGIVSSAFHVDGQSPDRLFGRPRGAIKVEYVIGGTPAEPKPAGFSLMMRTIARVLGWRLGGKTWPHPFFARDTRNSIYPVTTLTGAAATVSAIAALRTEGVTVTSLQAYHGRARGEHRH